MSLHSRYRIYLDHKSSKWYRWDSLKFAINKAVTRDYVPHFQKQKQIYDLQPINSKYNDLLQLVDILLGATTSTAGADAKCQLAEYVKQKLINHKNNQKFFSLDWTPLS